VKVAYVVHRYGPEITGGAEHAVRMLAEHLASSSSWEVDVFTTCAGNARDWHDEYPPGRSVINGVAVERVAARAGRNPAFEALSDRLQYRPSTASPQDQERWVDLQGPLCPDVLDAAQASDPSVAVFCPYLYYPTVRGVPRFEGRAVMHPAAHDEVPIRFPIFRRVFGGCAGLGYFTDTERRLVERRFRVAHKPQTVVGLGVDRGAGSPEKFRAAAGLGDRPYLLCVGRVEDLKGTGVLARFFAEYKRCRPGPLMLAFVGPVVDAPPPHPDIVVTGPVDEDVKWGALADCVALVSPSPLESFSLVLIEAWTVERPVLVNAVCAVTREHCVRSGGGMWFGSYAVFEAAVDRLVADDGLRARLGAAGAAYAAEHYQWPVVLDRYTAFLSRIAAGR
jgi:glycosyltransferase involved in cell wall biosynthesis